MIFLPIVGRELRVAARRRGTYWLRSGVAAAVIIVSAWIFLMSLQDSSRDLSQRLFYTLTGMALASCLMAGARSTADCLSEEKREGTLGLLFLTDLKGYDVVLGKLASNSLGALYGVLAIVPVLGIPLLLGGVTPGEFARVALVLVNTLFFSLSAGMFASALSRSARKSIAATCVLVLLFTAGIPALGAWFAWQVKAKSVETGFLIPCSVYTYFAAQDSRFNAAPKLFYWSVGTIQLTGWAFLGLASLVAPRSWQDRPAGARAARLRDWWLQWSYGDLAERKAFRTRLLNRNAFFWLAARARLKPAWVWAVFGAIACGWVWGALKFGRDWFNEGIYVATGLALNSILKTWLASEAGRQLSEDRRMGTLELLLSTPLRVKEILRGQWLALRRQFLGPLLVTLLAEVVMLAATLEGASEIGDRPMWIGLWTGGMLMLVADLAALYWLGMWMGLAARNARRAYSGIVWRILVLPWLGYAGVLMLIGLLSFRFPRFDVGWKFFESVWFGLGVIADLSFGLWARHKLLTRFRAAAERRYETRVSLWQRLFGPGSTAGSGPPAVAITE